MHATVTDFTAVNLRTPPAFCLPFAKSLVGKAVAPGQVVVQEVRPVTKKHFAFRVQSEVFWGT